jgi:hypothetical protein
MEGKLTPRIDAVRTRYLLGNFRCDRTTRLCSILCSIICQQGSRTEWVLRLHGTDRHMVHLVSRRLDKHVPPTRQMRIAKQKVMHHHRLAARLLQRRYPLRTITRHFRCPTLRKEKGFNHGLVSPRMLVSLTDDTAGVISR